MNLTKKEQLARKKVCLPLDVDNLEDADKLVRELRDFVGLYKIGMELFTNEGPYAIKMVQNHGADVFLDLKYYDIPNTVRGAAKAATRHGVYTFNIHASGGTKMMEAALQGIQESMEKYGKPAPKVTGVTVLTSFDEALYLQTFQPLNPILKVIDFNEYIDMKKDDEKLQEEFNTLLKSTGLKGIIQKQVLHLATLSNNIGLDGIVCSAADLYAVKDKLPEDFMYVTPGVKGPKTEAGADQKRVFTPGNAIQDGSTILVIGRAITKAPDKKQAAYEVLQDMAEHL